MFIKNLSLMNFRNYNELNIELNSGVNIFIGDNAQGKTNIIESIYYCSLGKSHRTSKDKELINWNKQDAYIRIFIGKQRLDKKIEIKIFKDGKKGIKINSIKIHKISELIGVFNVVIFSPEDLKIVKDSPSYRRRFLDIELSKIDNKYYYNLVQYNKVLDEKNALLKRYSEKMTDIMDVYDEQLSSFGTFLIKERFKYIEKLNLKGKNIHKQITSEKENIEFKYLTSIVDWSNVKQDLKIKLLKSRSKDIERRTTSIGPHRDDFSITINNIDTRSFGSQGQQRTSVLTIKFSSLEIIKDEIGEYPVLLLDDVLSELDLSRQKYILNSIKNVQTIITCTDAYNIKKYLDKDIKVFRVKDNGLIVESL